MTDASTNSNNDPERDFEPENLDWVAFCYIADELDAAQRAEFESRLENDQRAQQSLVDAMRESQLIFASSNSTSFDDVQERDLVSVAPRALRNNFRRVGILFGSAAAVLLIVCSWIWNSTPTQIGSDPVASADSDRLASDRLASAWIDTLELMPENEPNILVDDDSLTDEIDDDDANWMFVALTDLEDSSEDSSEGTDSESF